MYEDEAIKNKKDIVLDLSDTEATAKIARRFPRKPGWKSSNVWWTNP